MCEKLSATLLSVVMLFCVRNCCFSSLSLFSHRETERCGKYMPEEEFCLPLIQGKKNITRVGRSDAEMAGEVTWLGSRETAAIAPPSLCSAASFLSVHSAV